MYNAYVSTGGWVERVLAHGGPDDVSRYIGEASALGFDLIELSTGFISLPPGADRIMIESEGITESLDTWRTDVVAQIIDELGLEAVMFEAADPAVFEWYVKGPRAPGDGLLPSSRKSRPGIRGAVARARFLDSRAARNVAQIAACGSFAVC